eukprot:GGOE01025724.1.p6 GENE.GGOE01025724.1~~GGOE01025724.1.p6  ORF type:complete len:129 (+),score=2.38 GGOE01025724.1:199-585(+)
MMGREACRRKEGVKQPIGGPPALPPKETEGKAAPPVPVECSCFPRHMYGGSCTGKRADWVEGQLAGTSGKLCREARGKGGKGEEGCKVCTSPDNGANGGYTRDTQEGAIRHRWPPYDSNGCIREPQRC